MDHGNTKLAEVLAGRSSPDEMLAALAGRGILVAARPDRSVVLGTTPAGERVLLGYTGADTYARHGGSHRLTLCDAETLLHIWRATGVKDIVIDPAGPAAVSIPMEDLARYAERERIGADSVSTAEQPAFASRGRETHHARPRPPQPQQPAPPTTSSWPPLPVPESLRNGGRPPYKNSRHPAVPTIRAALTQVLPGFPQVHHVWISDVCSGEGGQKVMLHVKVHSMIAAEVVDDLHKAVLGVVASELGDGTPRMLARATDPGIELLMLELGCHVVCRRP